MSEVFRLIRVYHDHIRLGKKDYQAYQDALELSRSPATSAYTAPSTLFEFTGVLNSFLRDFCEERGIPMLTGAWIQWDADTAEKNSEAYTDGQIHIPSIPPDSFGWYFIIFSENTYHSMTDPEILNIDGRVEDFELKHILVNHLLMDPVAMHWVSMVDYEALDTAVENQRMYYTRFR